MTSALTPYHQKVLRTLAFALWQYVKEKGLGEVFLHLYIFITTSEI